MMSTDSLLAVGVLLCTIKFMLERIRAASKSPLLRGASAAALSVGLIGATVREVIQTKLQEMNTQAKACAAKFHLEHGEVIAEAEIPLNAEEMAERQTLHNERTVRIGQITRECIDELRAQDILTISMFAASNDGDIGGAELHGIANSVPPEMRRRMLEAAKILYDEPDLIAHVQDTVVTVLDEMGKEGKPAAALRSPIEKATLRSNVVAAEVRMFLGLQGQLASKPKINLPEFRPEVEEVQRYVTSRNQY